ncbi:MAG: PAS domain S-box protein [Sphingobacteriales bacterium]|nr:MAG: PAS domain S-box protein [Sphingobacteriales bacterium]
MKKNKTAPKIESDDHLKLLDYQKRISNILESFTDGFFELDSDWTVTYWNQAAENLLSLPRNMVLGNNIWELFPEAVNLKFYQEYHSAFELNISVRFEEYLPSGNIWFEVAAFPSGSGLSVYFKDITARMDTLRELEMEKQKYRDLFNRSPVPQWVYDLDNRRFLDVNEAAIVLYGYTKEAFLEMTIDQIRPEEDLPGLNGILETIVQSESTNKSCVRHRKKNGDLIDVNVEGKSIIFEGRNARLVMVIDRTIEIQATSAMRKSILRSNIVSKATSDAIWDWDIQTGEMTWNKGIEGIYGYSQTKYNNEWWKSKIHPDDLENVIKNIKSCINLYQKRLSMEYRFQNADGTYRFVLDRAFIIFDDMQRPIRMIGSMQDITEKVQYIQDIEAHIARHREICWIQAHKVRGPLSSILGLVSVIEANRSSGGDIDDSITHLKNAASELDEVLREIINKR